jgi:rRNA maturation endonuclease Nob1
MGKAISEGRKTAYYIGMVKCRKCGKLNEEESKFCQECGQPL